MSNLNDPNCPDCGHAKMQHPKVLGFCMVCQILDQRGLLTGKRCNRIFVSIFTQAEIEQYARVSRTAFDQWAVCAVCKAYWMEHIGALCPSGNSTFKPLIGNA